jgi:probable HAF family extracellular repeat protein
MRTPPSLIRMRQILALPPPSCFLAHAFRWKDGVITDLGALPGTNSSAAGSINARGWSTGQSETGLLDPHRPFGLQQQLRAVLWKHGEVIDLGTLGGIEAIGIDLNNRGQVVGFSTNTTGFGTQIRSFIWENGVIRDLGTLGGLNTSLFGTIKINERGQVTGSSFTNSTPNSTTGLPTVDPFLWEDGTMKNLGTLGGTLGFAMFLNNRGQVIGQSNLAGDVITHAFIWDDGVMTDLGTLGGNNSEAIWINDAGDVAGSADLLGSQIHDAVLWRKGKVHDLGTVAGDPCSRGRAINARGQVVGGSSDCANFLHAFLLEEGGPMLDLNTLIPPGSGLQLTNAFNINDRGEILAKSDPLGVTPIDDADLGHLVLLVPCEQDDKEGCEGSAQATTSAAPRSSAPILNHAASVTSPQRSLTPRENVAAWRARMARQFHFPVSVLATPKN